MLGDTRTASCSHEGLLCACCFQERSLQLKGCTEVQVTLNGLFCSHMGRSSDEQFVF